MAHVNLLDVLVVLQCLRNWTHLSICKAVLQEVEISKWKEIEQVGQSISTDMVVINVDIIELLFVLKSCNQCLSSFVIDLVV